MSPERAMTRRDKAGLRSRQTKIIALEDDNLAWGVILTIAALTGLCVATLFSVSIG
jgi:hypothetical protein